MKENKAPRREEVSKPLIAERRQSQRIPLVIMEVRGKQSDRVFLAYANDISAGGLSLTTENRLNVGDRVPIEMVLPDNKTVMTCIGEVMWKKEIMKGGIISQGVGVRFHDLEDGKKKVINKMISSTDKKGSKK
ncbi:MAG: PilZ domain-containing protein [Nitrospirae bacterium]|nr:PilZ domain-containing protein [Nitrospirota bacterium]MBI3353234.1 PilZ domain-containing protein [Nitrospirota bacterium]